MKPPVPWSVVTISKVSGFLSTNASTVAMASSKAICSRMAAAPSLPWAAWSMRPPSTIRKKPSEAVLRRFSATLVISESVGVVALSSGELRRSISKGMWLLLNKPSNGALPASASS